VFTFSCAKVEAFIIFCFPIDYGFFFWPAQGIRQGFEVDFEIGALESFQPQRRFF
jgi:hypothetical protein